MPKKTHLIPLAIIITSITFGIASHSGLLAKISTSMEFQAETNEKIPTQDKETLEKSVKDKPLLPVLKQGDFVSQNKEASKKTKDENKNSKECVRATPAGN